MVEFINKLTGSKMYVADDRVDEYKAAGHTVAASVVDVEYTEIEAPVEKKTAPKKRKVKE